jgi:hypothetical protein
MNKVECSCSSVLTGTMQLAPKSWVIRDRSVGEARQSHVFYREPLGPARVPVWPLDGVQQQLFHIFNAVSYL